MTYERGQQIYDEAKRRIDLWLTNSSFMDMTVGGSYLRFNMSLGMLGYPIKKEKWMTNYDRFITDEEFDDPLYDIITSELFRFYQTKFYNENR